MNGWMGERHIKEKCEISLCLLHRIQKEGLAPSCRAEFAAKNIKRKQMSVWPEADASFPFISFLVSSGGFLCRSKVEHCTRD